MDTEDYGAESGSRCVWWSNRVAGGHMCPDTNPATWGCSHPPAGTPTNAWICPLMAQCRAEALEAGKAVMSAVIEEWPTARIMTTFGPSLSDNGTSTALNPPHYTFNWRVRQVDPCLSGAVCGSYRVHRIECTKTHIRIVMYVCMYVRHIMSVL